MTRFAHLRRYGVRKKKDEVETLEVRGDGVVSARGKVWDLRSGSATGKALGFYPSMDGRRCEYDDGKLVVVHPDGRRVVLAFPAPPSALASGAVFWLGAFLVARDTNTEPWIVMNADTGAPVGRLKGQRKHASTSAYVAAVFDPHDGETLHLCEAEGVRRLRAGETDLEDVLGAAPDIALVACAPTSRGDWALVERPEEAVSRLDVTRDAVVVRDAAGKERARLPEGHPPFQVTRLGERLLVKHADGFLVLDDDLRELSRVPFFDDDTFARTIPLPCGREWIAVGGYGQWDHYGDVELMPTEAAESVPRKAPPAPKRKGKSG